jgi:Di-haem cytochrome c peroxidase
LTQYVISPTTLGPSRDALGQKLFFEPRLSGDGTVACATCRDPARAFTDGRPLSVGIHGRVGQRNAPAVLNALYNKTQFWDGRVNTLEEQADCHQSLKQYRSGKNMSAVDYITTTSGSKSSVHRTLRRGTNQSVSGRRVLCRKSVL